MGLRLAFGSDYHRRQILRELAGYVAVKLQKKKKSLVYMVEVFEVAPSIGIPHAGSLPSSSRHTRTASGGDRHVQ